MAAAADTSPISLPLSSSGRLEVIMVELVRTMRKTCGRRRLPFSWRIGAPVPKSTWASSPGPHSIRLNGSERVRALALNEASDTVILRRKAVFADQILMDPPIKPPQRNDQPGAHWPLSLLPASFCTRLRRRNHPRPDQGAQSPGLRQRRLLRQHERFAGSALLSGDRAMRNHKVGAVVVCFGVLTGVLARRARR